MEQKFFICEHCGNIIAMVKNSGVPVMCCGQKMTELIPGTTDASQEKHVPVWKVEGNLVTVTVGSVEHPMLPEHHIAFVYVEFEDGGVKIDLKDKPVAEVCICNRKPVAVYEYCNLHGLWKTEL